jgi:5-formyltetrahydrofolate cyclo-ligase
MQDQKKERRSFYRKLQGSFPEEQFGLWNERLSEPLKEYLHCLPSGVVAVYQARSREADLSAIFPLNREFCFPRVLSKNGEMEFRLANPMDPKQFEIGSFGILEPKKTLPLVDKREIVACFVPLLAFDAAGRRLGQGMGFYDRFLQGFSGKRIGVAFEWQFSPTALPSEETDQVLDLAITEHGIRKFSF